MRGISDKIPSAAYEPHEAIVLDVHIAVAIELQFSESPPKDMDEWRQAVYENVREKVLDSNFGFSFMEEDVIGWEVLEVER